MTMKDIFEVQVEPENVPPTHDFKIGEYVRVNKVGYAGGDIITAVRGDYVGFGSIHRQWWFKATEVWR